MKNSGLVDLLDNLFHFLEIQFRFVKDQDSGPYYQGWGAPHHVFYIFIFAEGLALGITGIAFWALLEVLRGTYRKITRPKYYPQENARRLRLAADRRKIRRRRTLNDAPTAADLRAQYAKVRHNPKEMIRFGSMLCDLEAYVDNGLVRDEYGMITGRRPGIKGWLAEHCPEMYAHYKSVIRYKALAEKFRQAVGLADPHPAAEALGDKVRSQNEARKANVINGSDEVETTVRKYDKSVFKEMNFKSFKEAEMILSEAGFAEAGLLAALGRRIDPDLIIEMTQKHYGKRTLTA